jgi:hypothetical protein
LKSILLPLKTKIKSYEGKILGFDTETIGQSNEFYLGTTYDGKEYLTFYDKTEMGDYLTSYRFSGYRLFATNLEFDLNAIYYPFSGKWDRFFIGPSLIFAKYKGDNENNNHRWAIFLDTMSIATKQSVAKLGKMLGLPKLEKPIFLGQKPKNEEEEKILLEYCKRDSEITYRFATYFNNTVNSLGAEMKNTIAGTAMDLFRRKYQTKAYPRPFKHLLEKFYDAYYGGRTEVFKVGYCQNKNYYDINSLYPFVMQNEYPDLSTIHYIKHPNKDIIEYEGISKVSMFCPDMYIPYLPVHYDNKVIFPIGNIKGTYTNFEIRKAIELGYTLDSIDQSIYYDKTFAPFKQFVDDLYKLRMQYSKDGNKLMKYVIKILMNSLYGRWGVKAGKESTGFYKIFDWSNPDDCLGKILVPDEYGYDWVIEPLKNIPNYANPILAIYTTAYARDKLYSYLRTNDVTYCDTDSIITSNELPVSEKLGDMKLEYEIKEGWFLYPKAYKIIGINDDKEIVDFIRWKGIPDKHVIDFWNNNFTVNFDRILKTKEGAKRHIAPNSIIHTSKTIREIVHKRKLLDEDIDIMRGNSNTIPISI